MKNQASRPDFGIQGKSLCICFVFLAIVYFLFLRSRLQGIYVQD